MRKKLFVFDVNVVLLLVLVAVAVGVTYAIVFQPQAWTLLADLARPALAY